MTLRRFLSLAILATTSACAHSAPPEAAEPIALDGDAQKLDGQRYLEVRAGTTIAATPDTVWRLLTNSSDYPRWNSTVISIEGNIAPDQRIILRSQVDPDRKFKLTISEFSPGQRLVWEDGGRMFRGVRTFTLTPTPTGGTQVTMKEVFTGAMMGMIAPKLPDFRPSFVAFLADLRREAEGDSKVSDLPPHASSRRQIDPASSGGVPEDGG